MSNKIYYVSVSEPENSYIIVYAENTQEAVDKLDIFNIPYRSIFNSAEALEIVRRQLQLVLTII